MNNQMKCDPYWVNNSRLSIEEIDKKFDSRTAASLKSMKKYLDKQLNHKQDRTL